jgi:hypothetical protein
MPGCPRTRMDYWGLGGLESVLPHGFGSTAGWIDVGENTSPCALITVQLRPFCLSPLLDSTPAVSSYGFPIVSFGHIPPHLSRSALRPSHPTVRRMQHCTFLVPTLPRPALLLYNPPRPHSTSCPPSTSNPRLPLHRLFNVVLPTLPVSP